MAFKCAVKNSPACDKTIHIPFCRDSTIVIFRETHFLTVNAITTGSVKLNIWTEDYENKIYFSIATKCIVEFFKDNM